MDKGGLWGLFTLLLFVIFLGIWFWAWSAKRRRGFEEAANLPFADEAPARDQDHTGQKEAHP